MNCGAEQMKRRKDTEPFKNAAGIASADIRHPKFKWIASSAEMTNMRLFSPLA